MDRLRWIRRHPSAALFAIQILGLLLYPLMGSTSISRALFNAFGVGIVLLALWLVRFSPGLNWVGVILATPAVVLLTADAVLDIPALGISSAVLEACLYVYAAVSMLRYMLHDTHVTTDELWAVGATFTLLAWAFAHLFTVCQFVQPNSFTAAVDPESQRSWIELLFLSVTTLTSTGLSDIVPIRPVARSLVMIEQIIGLAYVAMLVSRIVGLTMRPRTTDSR